MFAKFTSVSLVALLPFAAAAVYDIQVGGDGGKLEFSPEAIAAQPGDQVVFHFHPKNHTVTQSSFADPCGRKEGGFDSGFIPVPANTTDNFPTWTLTVNNTDPTWVYCRQAAKTPASHCGAGMVFAINCGLDGAPNSFTNFKKSALAVGASLATEAATPSPSAAAADPYGGYGGYGSPSGSSASAGSYGKWAGYGDASTTTWTAAYGDVTLPPAPIVQVVTDTVTLDSEVWTTTYSSYPGSPAPTPASAAGNVHKVIVGGPGKLLFDPPHIAAQPRDTIVFEFHQKNHTVTQSSFDDPCRKLVKDGVEGFDSGFVAVADDATEFPTWSITVNGTEPIWAYCRQKTPASHCGAGMVFAINSDEGGPRSFDSFKNVATALNGTAAAANAPSGTGASGATTSIGANNGAMSVNIGGTGAMTLTLAAVFSLLL
ncbi:hypothetical protein BDN71DRAFT_1502676 [Pleurotus eryngii]|uniref:Cupredoxin n=1 Tax=Pleurotus eryngii TaxID=5323 RepID=A0A9P6A5T9_PLEER|nr:hypothetical protein BDN71DRAFT_1502676 [Pleurotus eryngii]